MLNDESSGTQYPAPVGMRPEKGTVPKRSQGVEHGNSIFHEFTKHALGLFVFYL